MRILVRLLAALLILAIIVIGAAFLLPREVSASRSIHVKAPPEAIFPYVNNLKRFHEWSPWRPKDPYAQYEFSGPEEGKGGKMAWRSNSLGEGTMTITQSEPPRQVKVALDLGRMGTAKGGYDIAAQVGGSKVTWSLESDLGNNPLMRWVGLMMERWIGADYEEGLARLKRLVETGSLPPEKA